MKATFISVFVVVMLVVGLLPVLAESSESASVTGRTTTETTAPSDTIPSTASSVSPSPTEAPTSKTDETPQGGIDGPPLVVNGQALSPDTVCAGVDGAVVFVDDDDGIRYIAGFEQGPFLRVILSDGYVMETKDVNLADDQSGAYARGILSGEFPEVTITMYLDDGLDPCPELG